MTPFVRKALILLLSGIFLTQTGLIAQETDWRSLSDTSYFKQGYDDWNLVESVLRSDPASVLFLLKRGADPNALAEGGMSALMYAAELGDSLIVKLLVLNGAELEFNEVENTTPLLVAVLNQQFNAAHILLKAGADPNHRDDYMLSPLLYAAGLNDYEMADLLLFFGADPDQRDRDGNNALMTAVVLGHSECADVMLQNELSPDCRDEDDNTPLMIAAQQGDTAMAAMLLEYDAEMEAQNHKNYTALCHAVRMSREAMVQMLADSGANVNHLISPRQSVYDLSLQMQNEKITAILKEKGGSSSSGPDFSEIDFSIGNSFLSDEHLLQIRLAWYDRKYGIFLEGGFDYRPVYRTVHVRKNDTLVFQFREAKYIFSHGGGRFFTLVRDKSGMKYGVYAAAYGLLAFPSYRGYAGKTSPSYHLALSGGLFISSNMIILKSGFDRYDLGTLNEGKWKMNITLGLRIPYKHNHLDVKEISY